MASSQASDQKEWNFDDVPEEEIVEHFRRWAQNPKVRELVCGKCASPEQREQRLRQVFGLSPSVTEEPDQTESYQIQPAC